MLSRLPRKHGQPCGAAGLDAADRLGSGPPDGAGVLAEVDGDDLGGDMDDDDPPGVDAAQDDLLPADHDDAGAAGGPLDGDRLGRGAGRRPGRAGTAQQPGLVPGQRAGRVRSRTRVAGSKNIRVFCSIRIQNGSVSWPLICSSVTWPILPWTKAEWIKLRKVHNEK
jgi:hypothetical protein